MLAGAGKRIAGWFGYGRTLGLVWLVAFVGLRAWDPPLLQDFRLRVFDFYQQLEPRVSPPQPIAIVDIDDASLRELGQWPWPRTRIADMVTKIMQAGAVAVAFDIVFAEPDRLSPALAADGFVGLDEETWTRLKAMPGNDTALGAVLAQSRVVLGQSGTNEKTAAAGAKPIQTQIATLGGDPDRWLIAYPGLLRNVPEIEANAAGRGLFTIQPERDGLVRRVPLVMKAEGLIRPALSTELLRVATGSDAILIKTNDAGISSVVVAGVEVPTDDRGRLWVRFAEHDPSKFVPARAVLNDPQAASRLAGKLVLVGTSAIGLFDIKATPVAAAMPGVEIHAQVIETILTKSYLTRFNFAAGAEILLAIAVGLAIVVLVPLLGAVKVLAVGAAVSALLIGVSWYYFTRQGVLLDVAYPLLSSFAVFSLLAFANYFREESERRQIRGAFGQYLSPDLVEQLASDPGKLVLGGETKTMSILFSDVRGFTSISESFKSDPQGLTRLMNRFLTPLSNAIMEQRGTIDKYMGDAIMAFWNAPLDDDAHAVHACEAALSMLERLEQVNAEREQEAADAGKPFVPLSVGVGVNTGDCVVGNMGSEVRFDYSVLGDAVNLASRLEGQTKTYGVLTIIGSSTADLVADAFALLELDIIRVKGKIEPETIHTILGRAGAVDKEKVAACEAAHAEFLKHYRAGDFEAAAGAIGSCRFAGEPFRLDGLYDLYQSRLALLRESPPAGDWTGVWTMDSK
jgi:adenylate cyclase